MKKYLTQFVVTGKVPFPIDMLRYDQCWPVDPESTTAIEASINRDTYLSAATDVGGEGYPARKRPVHRVKLAHYAEHPGWMPTTGRWSSFLWAVEAGSVA